MRFWIWDKAHPKARKYSRRLGRASQDDLLTLIYTSGTTGEPKGVMLTHSNMFHSGASHDIRLADIPMSGMFRFAFCPCPMFLNGHGRIMSCIAA